MSKLPKILFCPDCQEAGQKSKVRYMGSTQTGIAPPGPYWDEDGEQHNHNPNTTRNMYRCSNGHSFFKTEGRPCPNEMCDWREN